MPGESTAIDWDAPLLPGVPAAPLERVSLYGTDLWKTLTPEQQATLSCHEFASVASVGLWFEIILMQALLRYAYDQNPYKPNTQYALTEIGDETRIGTFVEIQKNASIGMRCKISSHTFVCEGVVIEDGVFVGHGVMFTNDRYPRATTLGGQLQTEADWAVEPTRVGRSASIGTNATIISGVSIGEGAMIGAGAVVSRDVPDYAIVAGVPARVIGDVRERSVAAASRHSSAPSVIPTQTRKCY